MTKTVLVLHRVARLSRDEFQTRYEAAQTGSDGTARHRTIHLPFDTDALRAEALGLPAQRARCDGVSLHWSDDPAPLRKEETHDAIARTDAYRVEEVVHWDHLPGRPRGRAPGIKMMAFVRSLPGLSPEEFRQRYLEHARVAQLHHPGAARYVQNFVTETLTDGAPAVSGIAELSFETESDLTHRFYRDDRSPKIVAEDVARFMTYRGAWSILAHEIVVQ